MQSLALRAAFTPLQQELAAEGRVLGDCLKCAGKANEGRAGGGLAELRKQQVYNNVAVAVTYYFLSLSSHFLSVTYSCLPTHIIFREGIRANWRGGTGR